MHGWMQIRKNQIENRVMSVCVYVACACAHACMDEIIKSEIQMCVLCVHVCARRAQHVRVRMCMIVIDRYLWFKCQLSHTLCVQCGDPEGFVHLASGVGH